MSSYQFTSHELEDMRVMQEGHMMDTCVIQACVVTPNSYNEQVESWPSDSVPYICGLDMQAGSERHNANGTIVQWDAVLRMPHDTVIDEKARIKITKRFGEVLSLPWIYEIVSPIRRGPSGIRITLKRIEL